MVNISVGCIQNDDVRSSRRALQRKGLKALEGLKQENKNSSCRPSLSECNLERSTTSQNLEQKKNIYIYIYICYFSYR